MNYSNSSIILHKQLLSDLLLSSSRKVELQIYQIYSMKACSKLTFGQFWLLNITTFTEPNTTSNDVGGKLHMESTQSCGSFSKSMEPENMLHLLKNLTKFFWKVSEGLSEN